MQIQKGGRRRSLCAQAAVPRIDSYQGTGLVAEGDPGPNRSQSLSRVTTHRPGFHMNGVAAAAPFFGLGIGRPFAGGEPLTGSRIFALGGAKQRERIADIGI